MSCYIQTNNQLSPNAFPPHTTPKPLLDFQKDFQNYFQNPKVPSYQGLKLFNEPMNQCSKAPEVLNHSIPLSTPSIRAWLWSSSYS